MGTMKIKAGKIKLGVLFLLIILCSCTKTIDPKDNTFHFYLRAQIRSLDPIIINDVYSHRAVAQFYEGLLHYHYLKRPVEIEPLLAEEMPKISEDGTVYTFKIKKNIYFHDSPAFKNGKGRKLVAQDFVYSWKRLADPKNKSENYWVFQDRIIGLDEWRDKISKGEVNYDTPIEGLQTPDDHTLIIKLKKPYYQLLYILTMAMTVAVPKEAVEHYGKSFDNYAIGTGAFILDDWIRGSRLTLKRNPKYHEMYYPSEGTEKDKKLGFLKDAGKRLPFLDKIVINEIQQPQPQYLLFLKGDLDVFVATQDYIPRFINEDLTLRDVHKKNGISAQIIPNDDVIYTSFNTENKYLKNKKLRQAMSLAYDQQTAIRILYAGLGYVAQGPIPPNLEGYNSEYKNPYKQYNIEKAKALLAEAGYPNGKGLPVFKFDLNTTNTETRRIADFFKQQMTQIGIKIKLIPNTWPQYNEKVKKKKTEIAGAAWNADYPDAENFLQLFYGPNESPGPNNSNFKNKKYDELYVKASKLPPGPERTKLYVEMQNILVEETPWIYHIHRVRLALVHSWLKNYKQSWLVFDTMKYYRVDGEERAKIKRKL